MGRKSKPTLLIIDDENDVRETTRLVVEKEYKAFTAASGEEGIQIIADNFIELVICDIRMSGIDGIETLQRIKNISPTTEVIMQTAVTDTKTAVKAIKLGAYDYITKPIEPDDLILICSRALEKRSLSIKTQILENKLQENENQLIMGKCNAMIKVFQIIKKVADSDVSVLITGETGTGKELVAQSIHSTGSRKDNPFIAINCGGIPNELLESELFGYEKGSFTSAESSKPGKFELANNGTIFLDEIGNMPMAMQAKLLRVLQEKEIDRVGGQLPIKIDVRIIAATNNDIKNSIKSGKFREDLYQRLNVIPLSLPSLRERENDIELLANYFLDKYNLKYGNNFENIDRETKQIFLKYSWPGNVRELQNLMQRIVTLESGPTLEVKHLPSEMREDALEADSISSSLSKTVNDYERKLIEEALDKNNYNIQKTANEFNIHRTTLNSKLASLGIEKKKN